MRHTKFLFKFMHIPAISNINVLKIVFGHGQRLWGSLRVSDCVIYHISYASEAPLGYDPSVVGIFVRLPVLLAVAQINVFDLFVEQEGRPYKSLGLTMLFGIKVGYSHCANYF